MPGNPIEADLLSPATQVAPTARAAPPLLEARGVHKSYGVGKRTLPVLKGIDLSLAEGEMLALLGASGEGKSTLLHVLGLLDSPSQGEIHFSGRRVDNLAAREQARLRRQHVGFVFQFYHLIPELNAQENVELAAMMDLSPLRWMGRKRQVRKEARELLDRVGLAERLTHRPKELSGGERQRVAIARALMAKPRVILADEPTGNLDSETANGVLELLFAINKERQLGFVLVTHNEELAQLCHRVVRMRNGALEDQPQGAPMGQNSRRSGGL